MLKYRKIIISWLIIVLFISQPFSFFLIFLTLPFTLFFLLSCLYSLFKKKKSLKEISIKISIILFSYALISGVHFLRYNSARNNADHVVSQIKAFKASHGKYPNEIGDIAEREFGEGKLYYHLNDTGEPGLYYYDTQMIYARYFYNFKENKWEYRGD